jgi:hypothetical protein
MASEPSESHPPKRRKTAEELQSLFDECTTVGLSFQFEDDATPDTDDIQKATAALRKRVEDEVQTWQDPGDLKESHMTKQHQAVLVNPHTHEHISMNNNVLPTWLCVSPSACEPKHRLPSQSKCGWVGC